MTDHTRLQGFRELERMHAADAAGIKDSLISPSSQEIDGALEACLQNACKALNALLAAAVEQDYITLLTVHHDGPFRSISVDLERRRA